MLRLAPLLFVGYTSFITTVHSQISASFGTDDPTFCCNPQPSAQIQSPPLNFSDVIYNSPNYGYLTTPTYYFEGLDNICYTYFTIDGLSFIQFTGLRYSDNSYLIEKYIASSLTGVPSSSRVQGLAQNSGSSSAIYNENYMGETCPGLKVYNRYYVAGRCDIIRNLTVDQPDFVHADSPEQSYPDCCYSQVAELANTYKLRGTQLMRYPNKLNKVCVTQFNGASCINADRVQPQDSATVPDTGTTKRCLNLICFLMSK